MKQQEPKKYYNPETSEYIDKKGELPPKYREIVRHLNRFGILEKRLINKVLRGEKSLEQLIEECKGRIDFEKFNYVEGFTEEERRDLQAMLESLFISEDGSDLTKQIQKKLEISINNIKKRFLEWHDQLYIHVGYYEKLEEFSRLKSELGSILRSNPTYALDDGIYSAYAYFAAYRPIKAGHLSVKKINIVNAINHEFRLRCQVCHIERSLSDLHSEIGEFRVDQKFQKFAELQTRIPEGKALLRWLQTNRQQASVQIAGIELAVDSLRKLFSSIKSVDSKYGIKYFADVLKGSQNKKIVERKGQNLPAYGLLSKSRPEDIAEMLDELVRREFLQINEYYDRGVYYPLVSLAERACLFLEPVAKTEDLRQIKDKTPVVFDKNTIVRTFSQFDNEAKSWILEKLAKDQEITILKELFRHMEGEEKQSLVENAIKNINKPLLEPFLLSLFNIENEGKNENIEKLKLTLCDYFLQHLDKRLLPIFRLKVAQEKDSTVKKKLQEIVTLCYMR